VITLRAGTSLAPSIAVDAGGCMRLRARPPQTHVDGEAPDTGPVIMVIVALFGPNGRGAGEHSERADDLPRLAHVPSGDQASRRFLRAGSIPEHKRLPAEGGQSCQVGSGCRRSIHAYPAGASRLGPNDRIPRRGARYGTTGKHDGAVAWCRGMRAALDGTAEGKGGCDAARV
jgi:hypothetical protein